MITTALKGRISAALLSALFVLSTPFLAYASELDSWITTETPIAASKLTANMSSPGAAPGSVLASPSQSNPNYYYHWIRDAALCMNTVVDLYLAETQTAAKARYMQLLTDYVSFSRQNQVTPNRSGGLGEPKFMVDGSAFNGDWGRPQNDGPALRTITLVRLAQIWLQQGHEDWVKQRLYDSAIPTNTVVKADLEFVAHHWQEPGFDLWEETFGQHFYTRLVQRRALIVGARLADLLHDGAAADFYRQQAQAMEDPIRSHWDDGQQFIRVTQDKPNARSDMDVATILGVLHAAGDDDFYAATGSQILSTSEVLRREMAGEYAINQNQSFGTAIGRYPNDVYNGNGTGQGNPWFIGTDAFAELYFSAANLWQKQGKLAIDAINEKFFLQLPVKGTVNLRAGNTYSSSQPEFHVILQAVRDEADSFLARVQFHADRNGSISEQINRNSGYMQGARDLSWSYASFLTAAKARTAGLVTN